MSEPSNCSVIDAARFSYMFPLRRGLYLQVMKTFLNAHVNNTSHLHMVQRGLVCRIPDKVPSSGDVQIEPRDQNPKTRYRGREKKPFTSMAAWCWWWRSSRWASCNLQTCRRNHDPRHELHASRTPWIPLPAPASHPPTPLPGGITQAERIHGKSF